MPAPRSLPRGNVELIGAVKERFEREFGAGGRLFFAPGRVDLVGAHLDYNGGDVLPLAVDRGIYAAARLRDDDRLRLVSLDVDRRVEVRTGQIGERALPGHGWAGYVLGVFSEFAAATGHRCGVDAVFGGDLPMASGLSSSAALEVASAMALDRLHQTALPPAELALLAHRAETRFVGVACGIMDQFASALGRSGHLLLLHCHDRSYEHVPLDPSSVDVLVMDTRKPRELAASEYNRRVEECGQAYRILCERVGVRPCLAAYRIEDLAAAGDHLHGVLLQRARHVVTEMQRVADGVKALRRGDIAGLGTQLDGSHRSARDDYEVSCRELDVITEAAREQADVFGARLTGAGFGGCAVALVRPGSGAAVMESVQRRFVAAFGIEPAFHLLHPGSGSRAL